MTSSDRHLSEDQPRWDYSICEYKENRDVFLEEGLFSIIVVAHGRPEITRKCLELTLRNVAKYDGDVELILVENGECEDNYNFFMELDFDRKVVVRHKNYGINHALNQGWALSRGEYVMILENDWETQVECDFLGVAKNILEENEDVSLIQLRDPRDPHENHGIGKILYNPWTCYPDQVRATGIDIQQRSTSVNHTFFVANHPNGFNNNPIIIRKQVYRECGCYPEPVVGSDPRHGETEYQSRVAKTGVYTAYIGIPVYWHAGRVQTVPN